MGAVVMVQADVVVIIFCGKLHTARKKKQQIIQADKLEQVARLRAVPFFFLIAFAQPAFTRPVFFRSPLDAL